MARPSFVESLPEVKDGQPFEEVLTQYIIEHDGIPEKVAAACGCSLDSLMRKAMPYGFVIVNSRRIERRLKRARG